MEPRKKATDFPQELLNLFDKYVLPISRLTNRLTRSFFGQSLLCVVQKK